MKSIKQAARAFIRRGNETLDVVRYDIAVAGLPSALSGFSAAVVADLHISRLTPYHDRILEALWSIRPGCILVAGDSMDQSTYDIPSLYGFFAPLARIAPAMAVLGNNDCDRDLIGELRAMYDRSGVLLLENETRLLAVPGGAVRVTGLTDPLSISRGLHPERDRSRAEHVPLSKTLPTQAQGNPAGISILLLHRPHLAKSYAALTPTLMIAGHAHGGQFRLPLIGGLYAPGQGIFPRLTSGLYTVGDSRLLVSRGLGNHEFPVRLGNRPHIPVAVFTGA